MVPVLNPGTPLTVHNPPRIRPSQLTEHTNHHDPLDLQADFLPVALPKDPFHGWTNFAPKKLLEDSERLRRLELCIAEHVQTITEATNGLRNAQRE